MISPENRPEPDGDERTPAAGDKDGAPRHFERESERVNHASAYKPVRAIVSSLSARFRRRGALFPSNVNGRRVPREIGRPCGPGEQASARLFRPRVPPLPTGYPLLPKAVSVGVWGLSRFDSQLPKDIAEVFGIGVLMLL